MSTQSTRKRRSRKAADFPLSKHNRGYWCKKVKGKLVYFGKIAGDEDGQKALALWLDQKDDLLAGRTPRVSGDGLTVADLCNQYLTSKYHKLQSGDLGVNCGLGNSDVGNLPITAVDLQTGWLNYPRPKTDIDRRCPLWAETIESIKAWLAVRPEPKALEHRQLVFVTAKTRTTWAIDQRVKIDTPDLDELARKCVKASDNPISKEVRKLLNRLGIKRKGVAFYSLRHVFETVGGESRDQVAVDAIMGHADESMAARYREGISDQRLRAVTEYVRNWLFGEVADAETAEEKTRLRIVGAG